MYQPSSYPPAFLIKQSLFAVFVAWFCCCLLLMSTEPKFFDVDYEKIKIVDESPTEESYDIKTPLFKKALMGYDQLATEVSEVLDKVAEFAYMMVKDYNYSKLLVSNIILLIPFFISMVMILVLSSTVSAERIVLLAFVNCSLLTFTIIFNVFSGIYYGYESLQITPLQVSSYALLNTIIFFFLFSIISFLFSFRKRK